MGNGKKIAFLFITRRGINQSMLWDRFLDGYEDMYNVYIVSVKGIRNCLKASNVHYLPNVHHPKWGDFRYVRTVLQLLTAALKDVDNYKFIICSESCIPLHPFPRIYRELTQNNNSFFNFVLRLGPNNPVRRNMDKRRYSKIAGKRIPFARFRRHQAQGVVFNKDFAEFLIQHREDTRNFREVPSADEHYYLYELELRPHGKRKMNVAKKRVIFCNWAQTERNGSSPKTYTGHLGKAEINKIRKTGALFMRKVAPDCKIPVGHVIPNTAS